MRVGEIAALKVSDVYEGDGSVKKDQTKGSEARTGAGGTADLRKDAEQKWRTTAVRQQTGNAMSANSLVQVCGRFYKLAGLSNASSHSGRRSFITNLAHKGASVRVRAALSGHRSISTTQKYIEVGEHQLRAAVEML